MKTYEEYSVKIQEALKVAKKGTSLCSSNPEMFNFNWNIGHVNQQDWNNAVEDGIQKNQGDDERIRNRKLGF